MLYFSAQASVRSTALRGFGLDHGHHIRSIGPLVHARLILVASITVLAACGARDNGRPADSVRAARPGTYAAADFQRLRWLEGRWEGRMEDDTKFYEQYRFVDDSTIVMHSFRDSTFAQASDSSRITLRGDTVASEAGASRWVAERLDTLGVEFAPDRAAINYFAWSRESPDSWTATLRWTDRDGRVRRAAYALRRLSR